MQYIVALVMMLALTAVAHASALTGDDLRRAVAGKTVAINTSQGQAIVRFQPNGSMFGRMGSHEDRGRWWISADRLCHRWNVWLDEQSHCLKIVKSGRTVYWTRDDGMTGTARIL